MANSRIMLVCKHCGKDFCIGKGYFGSYSTSNEELHKQLNIFYGEHEHGCCSEDTDCSDNARNHFAILEEGEGLDVLAADVVPKSEWNRIYTELEGLKSSTLPRLRLDLQMANTKVAEADMAKAEVAREIFEEIEKIRLKEIKRCEVMREKEVTHAQRNYWEGGEHSLRQLSYWIAELKKKYTEEKK